MVICASCRSDVGPGERWCAVCRGFVQNPSVGRLASPIRRLGAHLLDVTISCVFLGGTMLLFFLPSDSGLAGLVIGLAVGSIIYLFWALYLFANGTTPGKRTLGLWVIKEDGSSAGFFRMLGRETIGKWLSALVLLMGYIWILIDKDRQGWHDKLVGSYVAMR